MWGSVVWGSVMWGSVMWGYGRGMRRRLLAMAATLAAGFVPVGCAAATPPTPPASTVATQAPVAADPGTPDPEAGLPGDPVDLYPYAGARLAVVGVPAGDTLRVRTGPGPDFAPLRELAPLADGVEATGHSRSIADRSWWIEVRTDAGTGWVNGEFVAQLGQTDDVTAQLTGTVRAGSMTALATAVVAARNLERDGGGVTVVDGPRPGDLDEVVVDVLGLADDAQRGERLRVFAVRGEGGYTARTVEATALCVRGVTADRSCL